MNLLTIQLRRALERSSLELAYEKASQRAESLFDQENARRLRLENVIIEDENGGLLQDLAESDDRINQMENVTEQLKAQLLDTGHCLQVAQGDLRATAREADNLKVPL